MGEKCLDGAKMEMVSAALFVSILFSGPCPVRASFFLWMLPSSMWVDFNAAKKTPGK